MRRATSLGFVLVLALSLVPVAWAAQEDVIEAADHSTPSFYRDGIVWEVLVEQWERGEKRAYQHLRLRTKGDNSLAEFIAPAKVSGRKLLMKDRAMWFVKPGLLKPVPISPRQRLLGSAAYGDLVSLNYGRSYNVTKTSTEQLDGETCYVFDLVAKKKDEVYSRLRYWVSATRKLGIRTDYFTESGTLLKTARFEFKNEIAPGGVKQPFLSQMVIHDPNNQESVSVLKFGRVQLEPVPDATFDLNLLMQ